MKKDSNEQLLSEEQLETVHGGAAYGPWTAHCTQCGWNSEDEGYYQPYVDDAIKVAEIHTALSKKQTGTAHTKFYYTKR